MSTHRIKRPPGHRREYPPTPSTSRTVRRLRVPVEARRRTKRNLNYSALRTPHSALPFKARVSPAPPTTDLSKALVAQPRGVQTVRLTQSLSTVRLPHSKIPGSKLALERSEGSRIRNP